jgi:hypothetical protein
MHAPELKALSRADFETMDDKTLLRLCKTDWYHSIASRELRRRGIDASRLLQLERNGGVQGAETPRDAS